MLLPMSRFTSLPPILRQAIAGRRLLKVIAGLTNFDQASVLSIARAAAAGGADLVDIACDPSLVKAVAAACPQLPICVSAVDPELFAAAVAAGATMVEIGNFDAFYAQGRVFSAAEVLELTRRSRALLPAVVLSVTVPHRLPLDQQEQLAVDLQAAGADLIQTEGGTSARPFSAGSLGLIEKAAPTLAAAHAISRALAAASPEPLPVLCASGLSAVTVPLALAAGASGVGVGSVVNRLGDPLAMVAVVRGLREAIEAPARLVGGGAGVAAQA
jgi:thiamine monophosphate synthase